MQLTVIPLEELDKLEKTLGKLFPSSSVIVVKSNICGFYPPSKELLGRVLAVASRRGEAVYLGDTASTIHSVENRLKKLGLYQLADKTGENVRAVDFMSVSKTVKIEVPKPHALKSYPFPRVVLEAGLLVNVARIGSHPTTRVTASLKNLFGLVASRMKYLKYHPRGMDKVIADISQIIKPRINVVEASDAVVVSPDPLAADIAASILIKVDPLKVKHFKLVAQDHRINLKKLAEEAAELIRELHV